MSEVRFRLLGRFEVLVDGAPVAVSSAAERALLALLLLAPGKTVSAASLIDRLWAEDTLPVDPVNALQLRVSKLRRTLARAGLPTVERQNQGYRLDVAAENVDSELFVSRLRRARALSSAGPEDQLSAYDHALALWHGEALADFAAESWAVAEAVRLEELRGAALSERSRLAISLGRHAEVIEHLEPLVSAAPTQEAMAGLLMVALYRAGRQVEALDVYQRTRSILDDELGLEPSTSLRSLHERVLRQDESLGGPEEISVPRVISVADQFRIDERASEERTNLPVQLVHPIGRDVELQSLEKLATTSRLVTLVGPGGAGKTTLGLTTSSRLVSAFRDGVYVVRLAPTRDDSALATAVADSIGVPLDGAATAGDVTQRLLQYLHRRHTLLLIDNCEHVIDAAATLIEQIMARCPDVSVLATSREALALSGEVQVPVGPLPFAPVGSSPEQIPQYPASMMFLRRAEALRPGLTLDDGELEALGRVCRALDGMPLALELAAARTTAMSLEEIADRLDRRFALLTTGTRTAEDRQRTLRATVDWSYDLLTDVERLVFARLSVFHEGWTLDSADAVASGADVAGSDVLQALARLVEQSLVVAAPGRTTRYRMLETLREYAADRLIEADQAPTVQQRHAEYFRAFAMREAAGLRGRRPAESLQRLRAEHANIRAALGYYAGPGDDLDQALHLAGALGLFWHLGRHLEGRDVLRGLLSLPGGSEIGRAAALQAVSLVERPRACIVHPNDVCARAARESLETFDRVDRPSEAALSRVLLAVEGVGRPDAGMWELLSQAEAQFVTDDDHWGQAVVGFVRMEAALKEGREEDALQVGEATAEAFRQLDDGWGLSAVLYHLGWGLRQFGRLDEAARVLDDAIDVAAAVGLDNTAGWALADLGIAHAHLGNEAAARDCFHRARESLDRVGDGAGRVLFDYGHGLLDQAQGHSTSALAHFTAAIDGFIELGTPVMQGQAVLGRALAQEALGELDAARRDYVRAGEIGSESGEPAVTAAAWEGQARLAAASGDDATSSRLLARAAELRVRTHRPSLDVAARDSRRTVLGQ